MKNKSGFILITVLWILAILSLLALSLSKGSSLELSLIRNGIGKVKSYAAARAGIGYMQSLLASQKTKKDTIYQCGIDLLDQQTPKMIFKGIKVDNDTHFDILYTEGGYGSSNSNQMQYGAQDEQGKINLNAINENSYKILSQLLQEFDVEETNANTIAAAVVDWRSNQTGVFLGLKGDFKGAKDDYYMSLPIPYKCKNKPLDKIEELLLVKGMTADIFKKIKNFITVFPKNADNGLRINFNTASDAVISAVVNSDLSMKLIDDEVKQGLIQRRNGADNIPGTVDDGDHEFLSLSATQQLHINQLVSNQGVDRSEFFRVSVVGVDETSGIKSKITAVMHRDQVEDKVSLVSWNRH